MRRPNALTSACGDASVEVAGHIPLVIGSLADSRSAGIRGGAAAAACLGMTYPVEVHGLVISGMGTERRQAGKEIVVDRV